MSSNDPRRPGTAVIVESQRVADGGTGVHFEVAHGLEARYSTVPNPRGLTPFSGRAKDLAAIAEVFAEPERPEVLVLHGTPGVGKSRLAVEYARRHTADYPGGTFFVSLDLTPPTDLARLLDTFGLTRRNDEGIEDQCRRALAHLGSRHTLLIYDNVPDERTLADWLPPEGLACHVLATSTLAYWPSSDFRTHAVSLLEDDDARVLVGNVIREQSAARHWVDRLVTNACGITVELCAAAQAIDYEVSHHRGGALGDALAGDTTSSFERAWRILPDDAQIVLRSACLFEPTRIPPKALRALWIGDGWSEKRFDAALDAAQDRTLIVAKGEVLDVHQCIAQFVLDQATPTLSETLWQRHLDAYIQAASSFSHAPANPELRANLRAYPANVAFWSAVLPEDGATLVQQGYTLGQGLQMDGRFDEARGWFERAVAEAEKSDMHGRIDPVRLGTGVHQVGYCYSRTGRHEEARGQFERAVAEAEKGDVQGRIDHERLGRSLHEVGCCYSRTERYEEALPWFERAVAVKEKGDVRDCVDYESLGTSFHQVGYCYARTGRYTEARGWFERSVAAAEKGDVQGRIDPVSMGVSLHHVGVCYASAGQYEEARECFERAVAEAEKGDVHGRADPSSVGKSLHQVGYCHACAGRYEEARVWLERAVAATEKGDVHGRVDSESLDIMLASLAALDDLIRAKQ